MKFDAPIAPALPASTSSPNACSVSSCGVSGSKSCARYRATRSRPRRPRLASICRRIRVRPSPWSFPSSIGLNVFVATTIRSRTSLPFVDSHSPMKLSLRPPPYASAVSKVVIPRSQAASMRRNASCLVVPWPKNAGEEPIPPKLPQPSTIRVMATPLPPRTRSSMRPILRDARRLLAQRARDRRALSAPIG